LKPFCWLDETILKHRPRTAGFANGGGTGGFPMFELMSAFIAAFSASIFLAHAVEAYLAQ
jgi:hypothetical protein